MTEPHQLATSGQRKLPALQFYPGDHLKDPSLRTVSLAAHGLWTIMLCYMHECARRGYLQVNGKPVSVQQLARMVGYGVEEVEPLLQELEEAGVFSRDEDGTIYSRRMVRDEQTRRYQQEAGKLGGNPNLLKGGVKGGVNPLVNSRDKPKATPQVKRKQTPSSSSSSSISSSTSDSSSKEEAGEESPAPPHDLFQESKNETRAAIKGAGVEEQGTKNEASADSKAKRRADELFDTVAEVTGSDPKASASYIAATCKALRSSQPPYTPDDVRNFVQSIPKEFPWFQGRVTLSFISKNIGTLRAKKGDGHVEFAQPNGNGNLGLARVPTDPAKLALVKQVRVGSAANSTRMQASALPAS